MSDNSVATAGEFTATEENLADQLRLWLSQFPRPSVLLLDGPLGVGKTTFVATLKDLLILEDKDFQMVSSPTYSLHHRYGGTSSGSLTIEHFDLYRLQSEQELDSFDFWEYLQPPENWILVEWSERVPAQNWPKSRRIFRWRLSVLPGQAGRRYQWQII